MQNQCLRTLQSWHKFIINEVIGTINKKIDFTSEEIEIEGIDLITMKIAFVSKVVDSNGEIVSKTDDTEQIVYVNIDMECFMYCMI